jgi:hypothetical protein
MDLLSSSSFVIYNLILNILNSPLITDIANVIILDNPAYNVANKILRRYKKGIKV